MVAGPVETLPQVQSGALRALGITTANRLTSVDIAPIAAQGVAGFDVANWFAVCAPGGTPPPILERLNREINTILAQPEVKQTLERQGVEAKPMDLRAAQAFVAAEVTKWPPLVAASGARVE